MQDKIILGSVIGVAVFVAVALGLQFQKAPEVIVRSDNPQFDTAGLPNDSLGSFNRQTVTATSSQVTITATPQSLKTLMQAADSTLTNDKFNVNYVVVQPSNGAIRYLIGSSDLITTAGFSAGTKGGKIFQTNKEPIKANPSEIYFVRDSGETANVTMEIPVFGTDTY